jgi:toxin ParE1/3/4
VVDLAPLYPHKALWSQYYELLVHSFRDISENPRAGKSYPEIGSGIFGLGVGKHIVFYRISTSSIVEIIRILHQRMDLKKRMNE